MLKNTKAQEAGPNWLLIGIIIGIIILLIVLFFIARAQGYLMNLNIPGF